MTRITSYAYEADVHCIDCTVKRFPATEKSVNDWNKVNRDAQDNEGNPVSPIFNNNDEADCPQHCGDCGVFLENSLTDDGYIYVRDQIRRGQGKPEILKLWKEFYGIRD